MKRYLNLCMLISSSALFPLPSGGQLIKGEANIVSSSDLSSIQVNANGKVILEWDQFNIGSDEAVSFIQSQIDHPILNRVSGGSACQILGTLQANCPIYLVNASGVFVGSSAHLETAGFIASTADISNDNFWSDGPMRFELFGDGKIINLGTIRAAQGDVALIARAVDNQGFISASHGHVQIATTELILHPGSKQAVFIRSEQSSHSKEEIDNSGYIEALSIELRTCTPYEKAIRHTGMLQTLSSIENKGRIYLAAEEGGCSIEGVLAAKGGAIEIAAKTVHLTGSAILDVSAEKEPGIIQIAKPAESVRVDAGAHLFANAITQGDGGSITLLAEEELSFYGLAKVCGGVDGGDGGVIHISSSGSIFQLGDKDPIVDARAPQGKVGTAIFDPKFVTISSDGMDPATGNIFASDPTGTAVISGSTLQTAIDAANVTIQANTDIVFADTVVATAMGNSLTLQAGRSILFNGQLTLNAADFNATINDNGASFPDRDAGIAVFQLANESQLLTQGGNIDIDVGNFGGSQEGEIGISSGTLDAGGGNISIAGFARQDGSDSIFAIFLSDFSSIQTSGPGTVTLSGQGGNGSENNIGIYLGSSGSQIQTDGGLIHLTGQGGGNGTGNGNVGIYSEGSIRNIGSGPIILDGFGGSGVDGNMGICLRGGQILAVDGDVALNGTGGGTGSLNFGIRLESRAQCLSTGAGSIIFSGIAGNGKKNNHGVILSESLIQANLGVISITGTGQGSLDYNYGIRLETFSQCISAGTGAVSLEGYNLSGLASCAGISISTNGIAIASEYGDIAVRGFSSGSSSLNQGVRIERGRIVSTGSGVGSANIHCTGVGSMGTDYCNGVVIQGEGSELTSIDGNIIVEGTAQGGGNGNQPILVDPSTRVNTTGSGTITYIEH